MKTLIIIISFGIISCSTSPENETSNTDGRGIKSTLATAPATTVPTSPDSILLNAFKTLSTKFNNIDSILIKDQTRILNRDSLLRVFLLDSIKSISATKDSSSSKKNTKTNSTSSSTTAKEKLLPKIKIDPNKPPSGQIKFYTYQHFNFCLPKDFKSQKKIPKTLIGTYYNTADRNIVLTVKEQEILYLNGKLETLFQISNINALKLDKDTYLFNYNITTDTFPKPYWVTDLAYFHKDTLSFKIIPIDALKDSPSKKELKNFIKSNQIPISNSFWKIN